MPAYTLGHLFCAVVHTGVVADALVKLLHSGDGGGGGHSGLLFFLLFFFFEAGADLFDDSFCGGEKIAVVAVNGHVREVKICLSMQHSGPLTVGDLFSIPLCALYSTGAVLLDFEPQLLGVYVHAILIPLCPVLEAFFFKGGDELFGGGSGHSFFSFLREAFFSLS